MRFESLTIIDGGAFVFMRFETLRVTPAMETGISDHVWTIEEIVRLVPEPAAAKRGPYKPRTAAQISN